MKQRNFRVFLLTLIGFIYGFVLLFIVSPESYEWLVDFHFFGNRAFSKKEEKEFDKKIAKQQVELYQTYYFNKDYPNILLLGFSESTDKGKWSYGNLAKISFTLPKVSFPVELEFKLGAYINQHNPVITVEPYINDVHYNTWRFENNKNSSQRTLLVFPKYVGNSGKVVVSFNIKGIKSPHELGYGNNINKLGLFIEEVKIKPKH